MGVEDQAHRDVESTLAAGRVELERSVARGRIALFGTMTVVGGVISLALCFTALGNGLRESSPWTRISPLWVFGFGALYALVVWRALARRAQRGANIDLVAFTDPAVIAAAVVLLRRLLAPAVLPAGEPLAVRFDIYALAPILMVLTFLGCVRVRRGLRLPVAAFAIAVYFTAILLDVGHFEPPQLLASLLLAVSAVLGSATAERMALLLERQARLSLLGSYLPTAFAERVSSDSVDLRAALKPQALEVTVLVTDLRGFTAMSEAMSATDVVSMLGEYHAAMLDAVDAHSGVVDKFLGDGMLLVFGLPPVGEAPPKDAGAAAAVRCAQALLARLAELNVRRAQAQRPPLAMGIGIHTGAVVAGTIGAGRRREFTVIGDAVNTASRLEGLTKTAGAPILISAATASRLGEDAGKLRDLAPVPVRGKAEPMRVFALDAPAPLAG